MKKDLSAELWSLQERRNRAELIEMFKMVRSLTSTSWKFFFHSAEDKITTVKPRIVAGSRIQAGPRIQAGGSSELYQ